jgi:ABC-type lipoprotein release transport system permease subunit
MKKILVIIIMLINYLSQELKLLLLLLSLIAIIGSCIVVLMYPKYEASKTNPDRK